MTPCSPKASVATWSRYPRTPVSSSVSSRSRKPTTSRGLSPAISIDQRGVSRNPRSTVGTVTEVYDYLRLLFARAGEPHCPTCGRRVRSHTIQEMVDRIMKQPEGARLLLLAPVTAGSDGHAGVFADALRAGFVRVRVDGEVLDLEPTPAIDPDKEPEVEIVVDRVVVRPDVQTRLADSLETALRLGGGVVLIQILDGAEILMADHLYCPHCNLGFPELEPRSFSFNSPHGACPTCDGLGAIMEFDPDLVIPDPGLSIADGAAGAGRGAHQQPQDVRAAHAGALAQVSLQPQEADWGAEERAPGNAAARAQWKAGDGPAEGAGGRSQDPGV